MENNPINPHFSDREKLQFFEKISHAQTLDIFLDTIIENLLIYGFSYYNILLLDESEKSLKIHRLAFPNDLKESISLFLDRHISLASDEITAICFNQRKNFRISLSDLDQYSEQFRTRFLYFEIQDSFYFPLFYEDQTLGVFVLFSKNEAFSAQQLSFAQKLLHTVSPLLAIHLNHHFLKQQENFIQRSLNRSNRIFQTAHAFSTLSTPDNVTYLAIKEITDIFSFDAGILMLEKERHLLPEQFYCKNTADLPRIHAYLDFLNAENGFDLDKEQLVAVFCFLSNNPFFFAESVFETTPPKSQKTIEILGLVSFLLVPFCLNNVPIGVLSLVTLHEKLELSQDDISIIQSLCNFAGIALSNARMHALTETQKAELLEKDRIIHEDLSMAKRIQQNVISSEHKKIEEMNFFIHYQPESEVGGDIYDISTLKRGVFRIFLADAIGHGVQAALLTMLIHNEYNALKKERLTPGLLLEKLNRSFMDKYYHLSVFFTCLLLDIDLNSQQLSFSSAGHPTQYLIHKEILTPLKAGGKFIGLFDKVQYETQRVSFTPEDKLLLFTDGLFEVFNAHEEELAEEGLHSLIASRLHLPIKELGTSLIEESLKYSSSNSFQDDLTLIGLEITWKNFLLYTGNDSD